MRYREHPPCSILAPYVECFWTHTTLGDARTHQRVLPDGCTDIIVRADADGVRAAVVGTMRTAQMVVDAKRTLYVAVRFKAGGSAPFLGMPLAPLTDCEADLSDLWGEDAERIAEAAATALDAEGAARALEHALLTRMGRVGVGSGEDRARGLLIAATSALSRAGSARSVAAIAAELGVAERTLERVFNERVGLGPKSFGRIARFRRLVDALAPTTTPEAAAPDWCGHAFAAGYYDQAHMIREFRALAGLAPTDYLRELCARAEADVGFVQSEPDTAP